MKKLLLLLCLAGLIQLAVRPPLAASPDKTKGAASRNELEPARGQTGLSQNSAGYLIVPPAAFTNDGSAPGGFYIDPDYGYLHGIDGPVNMWAPIYLPPGVSITEVEVFLEDWDLEEGHDVCIYLDRMDLSTGYYDCCLAEICSTYDEGPYVALVDDSIDPAPTSSHDAYQLNIYGLFPETYIYGVRVGFGAYDYLPVVVNETP